jgi:4a-hydroxytetrahydrobiopterin dehydratase
MSLTRIPVAEALEALPSWSVVEGREAIFRRFVFADFVSAFAFMCQAALVAERMNHHPEWSNVYGTVDVLLTTHDSHGITRNDLDLAAFMDGIAPKPIN